jgi:hypothetical protein
MNERCEPEENHKDHCGWQGGIIVVEDKGRNRGRRHVESIHSFFLNLWEK